MRMQSSGSMLGEKAVPRVWRDRNMQWGYEQAEYHTCSWKAEGSKISNLSHWLGHKAVCIIPESCSLTELVRLVARSVQLRPGVLIHESREV